MINPLIGGYFFIFYLFISAHYSYDYILFVICGFVDLLFYPVSK